MKRFLVFAFVFLLSAGMPAQTYSYKGTIGSFEEASAISVTSLGFIYVTDTGSDEVYMLDSTGVLLKEAGGYGWQSTNFDDPADVFATPLSVFVCDFNNHRIKQYDKQLNFVSELYTRENTNTDEAFGYPLSCVTSPQGELFLLDTENERILKFDFFGTFSLQFGGFDFGSFALQKPQRLAITGGNIIFVLDGARLVLFDTFGNGIAVQPLELPVIDISAFEKTLVLCGEKSVFLGTVSSSGVTLQNAELSGLENLNPFVSAVTFNNYLYILTKTECYIFEKQ